jgi:hypothetical protein
MSLLKLCVLLKDFINDKASRTVIVSFILRAPLSLFLVIISGSILTAEILGVYYSINSILSIQSLASLGILINLKRAISHSKYGSDVFIDRESSVRISDIDVLFKIKYTFHWFVLAAILYFIATLSISLFTLRSSANLFLFENIAYSILACAISSVLLLISPMGAILECTGLRYFSERIKIYGITLGFISSIVFLYLGVGILSLLMILFMPLLINFYTYKNYFNKIFHDSYFFKKIEFSNIFSVIRDNRKISLVWSSGFMRTSIMPIMVLFFISPDQAGIYGITFSIISLGCGLASNIMTIRIPVYSALLKSSSSKNSGNTFLLETILLVFIQFIFFAAIFFAIQSIRSSEIFYFPFFDKILSFDSSIILLSFLSVSTISNLLGDFARQLGGEPFFRLAIFSNFATPLTALAALYIFKSINVFLIGCLAVQTIILILCIYKYKMLFNNKDFFKC